MRTTLGRRKAAAMWATPVSFEMSKRASRSRAPRLPSVVRPARSSAGAFIARATAPANAGGLLLVGMTPGAAVETAFNAWYDTEHVPALARVPGVLCARRFRTSGGNPKYIALYHLASPGVVDSPEWKQASESTPMPQNVRDQITNRLRLVCRSYVRG